MTKIPTGETIVHAYRFAFLDFPKIFGIAWAPLAVAIAVGLMMTPGFFGNHIDPNDRQAIARFSLQMLPLGLLILLPIRAMIAAGITELALRMRSGVTFVYFSVGSAVWRFLASWLLVVIAMVVLIVGTAIVVGLLLAIGAVALGSVLHGTPAGIVAACAVALLVFAFYAAIFYLSVRLTFFIPPVVVAEKKIDLARVWQLSHGNFWRIFLVGLAIIVPFLLLAVVVSFATHGPAALRLFDIFSMAVHGAKEDVLQQQMQAWGETMRTQSLAVWPYTAVFELLSGTVMYGLLYGASVHAYSAIQADPVAASPA